MRLSLTLGKLPAVLESLDLPFVQRGLAEIVLLAVGAGLIGTWIVLRGLAFHAHAVGTAAFPGLVLADGLGFAAPLGALGAAAVFALLVAAVARRPSDDRGAAVAVVLVGMLALGVILASDVFESSAGIETLLFGSLLLIDGGELALAAGVSGLAVLAAVLAGRHWVAHGFDAGGETVRPPALLEPALLILIALAVAAAVTAVGALLVTALFVVPAATARLWVSRMRSWQLATIALCAAEGVVGVVVSVELNAPPGPTIAVIAGVVFALAALVSAARRAGRGGSLARWGAAGAAAILIGGCGGSSSDEPSVVATTAVAGDLVGEVVGEDVEVRTLLAANTDPHEYEPRPDDVEALAQADLVFASGGDVDAWIEDAIQDSGSDAELVVLADSIPHPLYGGHSSHEDEHAGEAGSDEEQADEEHAEEGEEEHADESEDEHADEGEEEHAEEDELDPHWWHDPLNVSGVAPVIAERLAANDEGAAEEIERRGSRLVTTAEQLDRAIRGCIRAIPHDDRKLVTDHDAFGYFAERYGLEIVGTVIPALTTAAQPSAGELADLRDTIEREGVKAVFPESSVETGLANTIAKETGATADYVLYGDSLGPEGSEGESWLGAEAANAAAIVEGLGGGSTACVISGEE